MGVQCVALCKASKIIVLGRQYSASRQAAPHLLSIWQLELFSDYLVQGNGNALQDTTRQHGALMLRRESSYTFTLIQAPRARQITSLLGVRARLENLLSTTPLNQFSILLRVICYSLHPCNAPFSSCHSTCYQTRQ